MDDTVEEEYFAWLDAGGLDEVFAERESDGEPWWVERFGDMIAP